MSEPAPALESRLRNDQFLLLKEQLDPARCRAVGQLVTGFRSRFLGEGRFRNRDFAVQIRKVSLSPYLLHGRLNAVVDLQDEAVAIAHKLEVVSASWGDDREEARRRSLGLFAQPGGGFIMHRDKPEFREAIMLVGICGRREITIVPAETRFPEVAPTTDLPPPLVMGEGDILFMDTSMRPWHSTFNPDRNVSGIMSITE